MTGDAGPWVYVALLGVALLVLVVLAVVGKKRKDK